MSCLVQLFSFRLYKICSNSLVTVTWSQVVFLDILKPRVFRESKTMVEVSVTKVIVVYEKDHY